MILNQTPVRTSRNFGINNVKLENINIPKNIKEFENVTITKNNSNIEQTLSNHTFTFGIGLEDNVLNNSNHKLKITTKDREDISIVYDFDEDNLELINQIEIEANGNANIIIAYKSSTNKPCFHNGMIYVKINENAKANVTIINLLNEQSQHFEAMENCIKENGELNYTIIDIGAKNSITNYFSSVEGNNAKNDLKTVYLGVGEQLKDINYIAHLKGKKSFVDIDVQGAIKDISKKNFKGTIDFKKGCKKAKGNENEYCMLLSDKAKSVALPMLLCEEDDVEGNHSTASGKVEEDSLFYIMTRGFSYSQAVKLIVKTRFSKIIERIGNQELQEEILQTIDKKLDE